MAERQIRKKRKKTCREEDREMERVGDGGLDEIRMGGWGIIVMSLSYFYNSTSTAHTVFFRFTACPYL